MLAVPGLTPLAAERAYARVFSEWSGARVFMTAKTCVRDRKHAQVPDGAPARLADSIESAILAEGGSRGHADAVLTAFYGTHVQVARK